MTNRKHSAHRISYQSNEIRPPSGGRPVDRTAGQDALLPSHTSSAVPADSRARQSLRSCRDGSLLRSGTSCARGLRICARVSGWAGHCVRFIPTIPFARFPTADTRTCCARPATGCRGRARCHSCSRQRTTGTLEQRHLQSHSRPAVQQRDVHPKNASYSSETSRRDLRGTCRQPR